MQSKTMIRTLAAAFLLCLAACNTTAGPFVTGIASDGHGKLFISKSTVKHNVWTGTIYNIDPTTEVIDVADLDGRVQPMSGE